MPKTAASSDEFLAALRDAGLGVFLREGANGARRWVEGGPRFDLRDDELREYLIRLSDEDGGSERFIGFSRPLTGSTASATHHPPRPVAPDGAQSRMLEMSKQLSAEETVFCCAIGVSGMREFCRAYGYEAGEALAGEVGVRIADFIPRDSIFSRISGSKFFVALTADGPGEVQLLIEELRVALSRSTFDIGFGPAHVEVSVGVAQAKAEGLTTSAPLDAAMQALDEARASSIDYYFSSDEAQDAPRARIICAEEARATAREVMQALGEDRIGLAFQPVVSARSHGEVSFHECLARMRTPEGGWIAAGAFMPKIEQLDLVGAVDRRILKRVLDTLAAVPTARLSVNISARTLHDPGWLRLLIEMAEQSPDLPQRLIVELTESSAVSDPEAAKAFLDDVRALGVSIALDDFGAGYSSFRHVRDFRPDWVKIDGSFSLGVTENDDNKLFVDTLVGIAKNFDMVTVAEFVETDSDAQTLSDLGVDCLQGYLFGKPVIEPEWFEQRKAAGL